MRFNLRFTGIVNRSTLARTHLSECLTVPGGRELDGITARYPHLDAALRVSNSVAAVPSHGRRVSAGHSCETLKSYRPRERSRKRVWSR